MLKKIYHQGRVIEAATADLQEIRLIEEESFSNPWKESFFKNELDNPLSKTFIFRKNGNGPPEGFIIFRIITDTIELIKIAVKNRCRKRGVGSLLMKFLLSGPYSDGINNFFLEVRVSNTKAVRFYKNFGFVLSGTRKNYYSDPAEDALVLTFRKN